MFQDRCGARQRAAVADRRCARLRDGRGSVATEPGAVRSSHRLRVQAKVGRGSEAWEGDNRYNPASPTQMAEGKSAREQCFSLPLQRLRPRLERWTGPEVSDMAAPRGNAWFGPAQESVRTVSDASISSICVHARRDARIGHEHLSSLRPTG